MMGESILYLVLFAPASLLCWFLPTYYAYKRDSSLAFMWVFFILFFQGLSFVLNAIGVPQLGAAGYFNGAQFFQGDRTEQKNAAGGMYNHGVPLAHRNTSPRSGRCNGAPHHQQCRGGRGEWSSQEQVCAWSSQV